MSGGEFHWRAAGFVIDIIMTTGYIGCMDWDESYKKGEAIWDGINVTAAWPTQRIVRKDSSPLFPDLQGSACEADGEAQAMEGHCTRWMRTL